VFFYTLERADPGIVRILPIDRKGVSGMAPLIKERFFVKFFGINSFVDLKKAA